MSLHPSALTSAILAVRDDLVSSGHYADFAAINAGYCDGFASDVLEALDLPDGAEEPFDMGLDGLMESEDGELTVMDRALLLGHWPSVRPPEGMDWDDLDQVAAQSDFTAGTHIWLCLGGRHYDAEAPEGVDNLFDLPFFRRIVGRWFEGRPAVRP